METKKEIWDDYHIKGYNAFSMNIVWRHIMNRMQKYFSGNVLDIGCGNGDLFSNISGFIKTYRGIDISKTVVGKCNNRFSNVLKFVEAKECVGDGSIPYENNKFDVVASCLVMQHINIKFIEKYIEESYRVLVDNGLCIFHCAEWKNSKKDSYFLSDDVDDKVIMDHTFGGVYSHTKESMLPLFEKYKFDLIDYTEYHVAWAEDATWLIYVARKRS